jgi:hypothetical protein
MFVLLTLLERATGLAFEALLLVLKVAGRLKNGAQSAENLALGPQFYVETPPG